MTDETEDQQNTVWKGKGPIIYSFSIEIPERNPDTPSWHSDTLGDAWKYRLSITGAAGQYENRVPEIFFIADTKPGIVRDMAAYIDLSRSMRDKQFLNLPKISPDNLEITDSTKGEFRDINVNSIFAASARIADAQPPLREPAYIIEITKNDEAQKDKRYDVSIIYVNGFIDHTGLTDSEQALHEGVDRFSKISAALVPAVVARYMLTEGRRNDIRPGPANMKVINFTNNPDFTVSQISTAMRAIVPPQPMQVRMPSVAMQGSRINPIGVPAPFMRHIRQPLPISAPVPAIEKKQEAPELNEGEPVTVIESKRKAEKEQHKRDKLSRFYTPKYGFDSVTGMAHAKKFFNDNIILGLKRPDLFEKYKKNIHDGFLLYGPPGIGKTYIVGALAKEANMKLLVVSIHQLLNMYLGETEKNIHEIFEQARDNAPCIILFDEIDGLGMSRRVSRESGNASSALSLNQLLMEMDGLESENENVIVMGTTNAPQDIDNALLRSGRFTNMLYMRPPDKEDRAKTFEFYVDDIPQEQLDYDKLGEESKNLSPADIKAVVKAAVTPLIAEAAESGEAKKLATDDLLTAIHSRRSSGSTMIKWYEDMNKVLQKGGFSEEDKLLYGDMMKDMKKRVKPPSGRRRRSKKGGKKDDFEIPPVKERLRA